MTMASQEEQMTTVYVFVDDYLKAHPAVAHWRRSPHHEPPSSGAEVITPGLLRGCLGVATLKQAYRFVARNHRAAFPHLPSYSQWLARLQALSGLIAPWAQAAGALAAQGERLYILDSKPIPVCKPIRHGWGRLLYNEGAYFGRNSCGWCFGFKLHALVLESGAILTALLTPGNWADTIVAGALARAVEGGIALADLGNRSEALAQTRRAETGLLLLTPAAAGDNRRQRALISSRRERVETTFRALWAGLWTTIKLKLLHYNLCLAGLLAA
jgi:transposase